MGCLPISDEQFGKVLGYLDAGKKDGATAVAGGDRSGDRGYFVQPTILTDTTADMSVVRAEIFGPVVCAMPFDEPEDIIPVANDSNYGLAAGVFTSDLSKAHRTAKLLRTEPKVSGSNPEGALLGAASQSLIRHCRAQIGLQARTASQRSGSLERAPEGPFRPHIVPTERGRQID